MDDQLKAMNRLGLHWTTWTYKDCGTMGWVTVNPESEYLRTVAPVQKCVNYTLLTGFSAGVLQPEYAAVFEKYSCGDLAGIMKSFAFDNCIINQPFIDILKNRLVQETQTFAV